MGRDNAVWTYRTPLPEVAGLKGYVSFYDHGLRIVVVERWPDGTEVPATFPLWGDAAELLRLIDVEPTSDRKFIGPAHGPTRRDVVEGGQFVAEAIVAATKALPGQRITSVSMIFTKAASFTAPVEVDVDVLRHGRTFSTTEVRISQHGSLRSVGLLLADSGAEDVIRDSAPMPDTPAPKMPHSSPVSGCPAARSGSSTPHTIPIPSESGPDDRRLGPVPGGA